MFMEKESRVLPVSIAQILLITSSYRLPQNGSAAPCRSPV
jgi:hypothetical protein